MAICFRQKVVCGLFYEKSNIPQSHSQQEFNFQFQKKNIVSFGLCQPIEQHVQSAASL